jgi:hypothetical protein
MLAGMVFHFDSLLMLGGQVLLLARTIGLESCLGFAERLL